MHEETDYNLRRLRRTVDEVYVEDRIDRNRKDKQEKDTHNIVVSVAGMSEYNGTERARILLSKKQIVIE